MMTKQERLEREQEGYWVCWRCNWEESIYSPSYEVLVEIHSQAHYDEEVNA